MLLCGCDKTSIQTHVSESVSEQDHLNVSKNTLEEQDYMSKNVTMIDHMSGLSIYKADGSTYKTTENAEFSDDGF